MLLTTFLFMTAMRAVYKLNWLLIGAFGIYIPLTAVFWVANLIKVPTGGPYV
jgi:K+ transporter